MNELNDSGSLCTQAREYYYDFIYDQRHCLIPEFIIGHINSCDHCRQQIEQLCHRLSQLPAGGQSQQIRIVNKWLELHFLYAGKPVACQAVKPFLPGLLDRDAALRIPTPITVHIDNCSQCQKDLEKIRQLNLGRKQLWDLGQLLGDISVGDTGGCHREITISDTEWKGLDVNTFRRLREIVDEITARSDSGVVTMYSIGKAGEAADSRIVVESGGGQPLLIGTLKRKLRRIRFRPLLRPAIAAAVVMLIASLLLFNIRAARAATLADVYQAVESVMNVYIALFKPGGQEPVREVWISQELNIYVSKTGEELVFHDIRGGLTRRKSLKNIGDGLITEKSENSASFEKLLSGHFGLLPFDKVSDLPAGAMWENVTYLHPDPAGENTEIYELTWQAEALDGSTIFREWRFFLNRETYLPYRIERYQKFSEEEQHILTTFHVVKYPQADEIEAVLRTEKLLF